MDLGLQKTFQMFQKAAKTISWLRSLNKDHNQVVEELLKLKDEQRQFEQTTRVSLLSVGKVRMMSLSK